MFGKASGFAANIDLSSLDGTTGFKLSGAAAGDYSGGSVASAGDVNGDGFADLIVGASGPTRTAATSGASYVVFGQASGFAANIDLSSARRHHRLQAQRRGGGRPERRLGGLGRRRQRRRLRRPDRRRPLCRPARQLRSGASYVVFGKASGFAANIDLSSLDGTTGFKLSGAAANDSSGRSVASAGDVNGDGFADLIVGAFDADPHGTDSGASYVVFGKASGFAANIDLSALDGTTGFKLSGELAAATTAAVSVASAGDVNGDGFADLIVGARGRPARRLFRRELRGVRRSCPTPPSTAPAPVRPDARRRRLRRHARRVSAATTRSTATAATTPSTAAPATTR